MKSDYTWFTTIQAQDSTSIQYVNNIKGSIPIAPFNTMTGVSQSPSICAKLNTKRKHRHHKVD
jgi:hypothetical protein